MKNLLLIILPIICAFVILSLVLTVIIVYIRKQKLKQEQKASNINMKKLWLFLRKKKKAVDVDIIKDFAINLTNVLAKLSNDKVGGLIVIENKDSLEQYAQTGNKIDSPFYSEFIYTIFYNHASALHDGAIIIRNWRIKSLSTYLPITKKMLDVKYGARHRAAFGITELTDAITFVVSETYGSILCIFNNTIYNLDNKPSTLVDQILKILFNSHYKLIGQDIPKIEKF